jgi:hypothetical protein
VKNFFIVLIAVFLLTSTTAAVVVPLRLADGNKEAPFYVGVSFCGNTTAEAKLLIDKVQGYTNLFVLQSWPVSRNETAVYEVCDYAVAHGLSIIVNLGTRTDPESWAWQLQLWKNGDTRWGDKFLGAYYDDEPGGAQIDYDWNGFLEERINYAFPVNASSKWAIDVYTKWLEWKVNGTQPTDYNAETQVFLDYFAHNSSAFQELKRNGIKTFISDYALHWFDYLGGYDVVLAQFGFNNSYVQAIQQARGAANMQNKEWGAIITWKYMQEPYLDSGEEIYQQMMTAYQAGAKYVVIFDYPQIDGNPYGVLTEEHFAALERFSRDVMETSKVRLLSDNSKADAVLVLPSNYGFGLRRADDRIWGYWGPDDKTAQVWDVSQKLLLEYGVHLDIVFDDSTFPVAGKYERVYYWNQTL